MKRSIQLKPFFLLVEIALYKKLFGYNSETGFSLAFS